MKNRKIDFEILPRNRKKDYFKVRVIKTAEGNTYLIKKEPNKVSIEKIDKK